MTAPTNTSPLSQVLRALQEAGYQPIGSYPVAARLRRTGLHATATAGFRLFQRADPPSTVCVQCYRNGDCYVYWQWADKPTLASILAAIRGPEAGDL